MSDLVDPTDEEELTLDPPGAIAVVGAGPLGIEAALYGRFLGYEVTLIEALAIGNSLSVLRDQPVPMLPGRCLSPLALSALQAQFGDPILPMTYGQWIDEGLKKLTETDLLRGRVRLPMRVSEINTIPIEADVEGEDTSDIPPDFQLTLVDEAGGTETIEAESVIVAIGQSDQISLGFDPATPYFFRIAPEATGVHEQDLLEGLRKIVAIYASLAGRADLDLPLDSSYALSAASLASRAAVAVSEAVSLIWTASSAARCATACSSASSPVNAWASLFCSWNLLAAFSKSASSRESFRMIVAAGPSSAVAASAFDCSRICSVSFTASTVLASAVSRRETAASESSRTDSNSLACVSTSLLNLAALLATSPTSGRATVLPKHLLATDGIVPTRLSCAEVPGPEWSQSP